VLLRFPRHKLADDGARFGSGQAVVTPKIMAAEALAWFRELEELGIVEDFAAFKVALVVERNATDPNRLDILLPPDLVNQLLVAATQVQFLL
jgi:phage tail sheath gpL-like